MSPLFSWVAKVGGAAPAVLRSREIKVQPKSLQMFAFNFKASRPSVWEGSGAALYCSAGKKEKHSQRTGRENRFNSGLGLGG